MTLSELRDDPDAMLRLAEIGPVTITSGGGVVGRYVPLEDDPPGPDHARDAAGMFRHLVRESVASGDMKGRSAAGCGSARDRNGHLTSVAS